MSDKCRSCGSYAINMTHHGRDGMSDKDLCDVCYWRVRAEGRAGGRRLTPNRECAKSCPYRLALMEIWRAGNEYQYDWDMDQGFSEMLSIAHDVLFGKGAPKFDADIGLGEK